MGCDYTLRLRNMSLISFSSQGLGILGESELWVVMGYKMCSWSDSLHIGLRLAA